MHLSVNKTKDMLDRNEFLCPTLSMSECMDIRQENRKLVLDTLFQYGYKPSLKHLDLGKFLCGENAELALSPFSEEFISNVEYNGKGSLPVIKYLQADHALNNIIARNESILSDPHSYPDPAEW